MANTPLWLIDFDGVVNACSPKPDYAVHPEWKQGLITTDGTDWPETWPMCYAPRVIASINSAIEAGVDVRWLSTWQHRTNRFPKFIEQLPDIPTLTTEDADDDCRHATWWKLPIAQTAAGEKRPFLWTDDDLKYDPNACGWVHSRAKKGPTTIISPNVSVGLTQTHLKEVDDFVTRYAITV